MLVIVEVEVTEKLISKKKRKEKYISLSLPDEYLTISPAEL